MKSEFVVKELISLQKPLPLYSTSFRPSGNVNCEWSVENSINISVVLTYFWIELDMRR